MKRPTDRQTAAFHRAVAKYLKAAGWEVLESGNVAIEHDPVPLMHNFQLVVRFVGFKEERTQ